MAYEEIERDLAFIRRTMECAERYRNIPPLGYLSVGALGLAGPAASFAVLGGGRGSSLEAVGPGELLLLGAIWIAVLLGALASMAVFSFLRARRHGIRAWNSLAARMVLSQLPIVLVSGLLTLALAVRGALPLVPALWLLDYSVICFAFSYFTGLDHRIQGLLFLLLGGAALCLPGLGLTLLAAGFGGVHIAFGLLRLLGGDPVR
jgi:hypothetical protein